ncbi:MAG: porin [Vicinamibacteria bacterium]
MTRKVIGRSAGIALALVLGLSFAGRAVAQGLFYAEEQKDGRFYVFNVRANWERFKASGETGVGVTRLGAGPNGETVYGDNETALELFFFKHGIQEVVERPAAPVQRLEWRDGKTRITLGSGFYMELSNRIQLRYTHELPDDAVRLAGTAAAGDSKGSFRIRRAKLKFEGWAFENWLQYEVQTNWPGISSANLASYLEDANINWDVTKGKKRFMLKFGQYKVPFGLQELTSSGSQQFVDRSLVSNAYFRGRDTGLSVWGVLGTNKLEYRLGAFNGNGLTRSANDNDKFQYDARVSFQPNGAVPLGSYSGAHQSESDFESKALGKPIFVVSAAMEQNDLSNVASDPKTNLKSTLFELDAIFKYKGFSATGGYIWGEREPQITNPAFDTQGYSMQAGYFLKPEKWEIVARYGQQDPNQSVSDDKITEIRGGLNYFYARHVLKVQADFGQIKTENAAGARKNHEFRVQTQLIF